MKNQIIILFLAETSNMNLRHVVMKAFSPCQKKCIVNNNLK